MPREVLQGVRNFVHAHGNNAFQAQEDYLEEQDPNAGAPIPLGYRREVHVTTVLVPQTGVLGFFNTSWAWITSNLMLVLLSAILLGTALYFLRNFLVRGGRLAKKKAKEVAEISREKARDAVDMTRDKTDNLKYRAGNLVERGKEKANELKYRAEDMIERGKEKAMGLKNQGQEKARDLKDNIKRKVKPDTQGEQAYSSERGYYEQGPQHFVERPLRRRIINENLEGTIGRTELEKQQRGADYAEFEDQVHTDKGQPQYFENDTRDLDRSPLMEDVAASKKPTKITTTVKTVVTDPKGISKGESAKIQQDALKATSRAVETSTE